MNQVLPDVRALRSAALSAALLSLAAACAKEPVNVDWYARSEIRVSMRNGTPSGAYEFYDPTGRLQVKGQFVDGKLDGLWSFYDLTGMRVAQIHYRAGVRHGTCRMWYASYPEAGGKRFDGMYEDGKLHGLVRAYHPNGRLRSERVFERGILVRARLWDPNGIPRAESRAMHEARIDTENDEAYLATFERMVTNSLKYSARR